MSIPHFLIPIVLAFLTSGAFGQDLLKSQPPLWSTKPDIAAFEKSENDRLAVAQRSIEAIVAVKDEHTIENTPLRPTTTLSARSMMQTTLPSCSNRFILTPRSAITRRP